MILFCVSLQVHSQDKDTFTLQEKVRIYREILKKERDPQILAEAHFKIAGFLEEMERDTEATAEYLKIVLNYPEVDKYAKTAEDRLNAIYDEFSERNTAVPEGMASGDETKDPAIFFTYITSLYGTYVDQGKYDKALHLLKKLVNMDVSNQQYYEDIGIIYLDGYNDADTALVYFGKLKELNPDHPKVYTDMGLAYEKKGNIEMAMKSYQKGIEMSPFNTWSIYGLSRLEALKLAKDKKLVKDWYFLGPFENPDMAGIDVKMGPEDDGKIVPEKSYKGLGGMDIKWIRRFTYDDSGYVDLNGLFENHDGVVAYALTYAYSESDRDVRMRIGSDDPVTVWLNGEKVFTKAVVLRPAQLDKDIVDVAFKKGWNEIVVKSAESYGRWGFYFRITDKEGNSPLNIIFDPLKDTARARNICRRLSMQKKMRIARTSVLYGTAVLMFLAGLYLVVSNVINKVKIRQMKEDFIASVSHELKTPLAAIKMFTETLSMGRVKEEGQVKEYYSTIIRETDRLTRFINKILDFQKIEKGKKIYSFERVSVSDIVKRAVDIYRMQINDERLVIEEEYEDGLPELELDEDAMLEVFLNFLTNAYKYSLDEKYIKVKTQRQLKDITVSVTDRGMGISKDKVTKIFDKFYRVDRDSTKDIKGSGIGLAFVKSVVEAHGGRIAVQSQMNKGSTFMISLPVSQ
ncbi:MAG: ATP-binding protein [Candidatus Omnitrophota bacterium]